MAKSDRAKAVEAVERAIIESEGRWREWGALSVARLAVGALMAADFEVKPRRHSDGTGSACQD